MLLLSLNFHADKSLENILAISFDVTVAGVDINNVLPIVRVVSISTLQHNPAAYVLLEGKCNSHLFSDPAFDETVMTQK